MASITIERPDNDLKRRLSVRAAENGRSMEAAVRQIRCRVPGAPSAAQNLGQTIHTRFAAIGGVDLSPAQRGSNRAARVPK
jgi:plasmid stability protein